MASFPPVGAVTETSAAARVAKTVIKFTLYSGNPFVDAFGWVFFGGAKAGAGEEAAIAAMVERANAIRAGLEAMNGGLQQNIAATDP